ncbi:hypothetical protein ANCDUO_23486, partial [Ancylostoma duodenale]
LKLLNYLNTKFCNACTFKCLYFQLTPPPYELKIDQACYWRNQPVTIHLQGVNESVWYKGFVIQPFEWKDGQTGERYVKRAEAIKGKANKHIQQPNFYFDLNGKQ